jgi:hypothetical protein
MNLDLAFSLASGTPKLPTHFFHSQATRVQNSQLSFIRDGEDNTACLAVHRIGVMAL